MTREELKERLDHIHANPGTMFGFIYPYILVIIFGVGLYYLPNIGNVAQQNVPPIITQPAEVADIVIQQPKTVPPVDLKSIAETTPALLEVGEKIFIGTCAACHGEEGTGTGPGSIGLNPAPRNFTTHEGWINGETLSGIYTSLQDGLPNSSMVAYDFLTPEEKFGLAHYIRTKFITDAPPVDELELESLDLLYDLTAGKQLPGQIPTETAINLIAEQNLINAEKIKSVLEKISGEGETAGSILISVTADLKSALSALINSDKWRTGKSSFVNFLTSNINQNGFNGKLFSLNENEWTSLFNYCSTLL